jgi:hypothetical protein
VGFLRNQCYSFFFVYDSAMHVIWSADCLGRPSVIFSDKILSIIKKFQIGLKSWTIPQKNSILCSKKEFFHFYLISNTSKNTVDSQVCSVTR